MTYHYPGQVDSVFRSDPDRCIACGKCVADCPSAVLTIHDKVATSLPAFAQRCIDCQHCLAICPTGAASVGGRDPDRSLPLGDFDSAAIDLLIRGRRSVRSFLPDPVEPETLAKLMETVSHAPTGVNVRLRRFTVVHDPAAMAEFRDRLCRLLVANAAKLPQQDAWLASAAGKWLDKGRDVIFRGAPHMLVVSASNETLTPVIDSLIALSYFDLMAPAMGVGTVWVNMVNMAFGLFPETRGWLGIPDDHAIGFTMLFGKPKIKYARTAQHVPESLVMVKNLCD